MNDPTNWNADDFNEGLATFKDNALAKEVAKRFNAYPELVAALEKVNQYFTACAESWKGATDANNAPVAHGERLDVLADEAGAAVQSALRAVQ